MPANQNAWVIMSFGTDASWEGNTGYADDIPSSYQFNSFVPNSRRVNLGDILLIRNRENVLGFARVMRLETELGSTRLMRCPSRGVTKFNRRKTKLPVFRCRNRHEFDQPTAQTTSCTWFTIHYLDSFTPVIPPTSARLFEIAYVDQGSQLSIRPVNYEKAYSIAAEISASAADVFAG